MVSRALIALAVVGLVGCGTARRVPVGQDVDGALKEMRAIGGPPMYFLGRRFAELTLTDVEPDGRGRAVFIYGTCEIPSGIDSGGCAPPVSIQNFPFDPKMWRLATNCHRLPTIRGVRTLRHDGLVLLTGSTVVKIYVRNRTEERRAARALRAFPSGVKAGEPLPPPRARVLRLADRVCGS